MVSFNTSAHVSIHTMIVMLWYCMGMYRLIYFHLYIPHLMQTYSLRLPSCMLISSPYSLRTNSHLWRHNNIFSILIHSDLFGFFTALYRKAGGVAVTPTAWAVVTPCTVGTFDQFYFFHIFTQNNLGQFGCFQRNHLQDTYGLIRSIRPHQCCHLYSMCCISEVKQEFWSAQRCCTSYACMWCFLCGCCWWSTLRTGMMQCFSIHCHANKG